MIKSFIFSSILGLFFVLSNNIAQIKIKELPTESFNPMDSVFFDISQTRYLISLNKNWTVYHEDNPESKFVINVPFNFNYDEYLTFENKFELSEKELNEKIIRLTFLGLSYTAELILNDNSIYKNSTGEIPFSVELPKELLQPNAPNTLKIKLLHKLDCENTIPLKNRFLFPQSFGGIFKDVYLHISPRINIADFKYSYGLNEALNRVNINCNLDVLKESSENELPGKNAQTNFNISVNIIETETDSLVYSKNKFRINFSGQNQITETVSLSFRNPKLWAPGSPNVYNIRCQLFNKDSLIDESIKSITFYSFVNASEKYKLNKKNLSINGTTYYPSNNEFGNLFSFENIRNDLELIKNAGFNSVRFARSVPHPYALRLCEKIGLISIIEIPLNSVPEELTEQENFLKRTDEYLVRFLTAFSNYNSVLFIGTGGSYLPNSLAHSLFIERLTSIIKNKSSKLSFASFISFPDKPVVNLDLYGVELYAKSLVDIEEAITKSSDIIGKQNLIISEATYPSFNGPSNGYLNPYTFEAQAKYFEQIINITKQIEISGFIINSIFDYRGDYTSLFTSFNEDNIYSIGILGEDRETNRLSYNVINSKLKGGEKVTIPMGSVKDNTPLFFIVFGVVLAVIMALLINSNKKNRQDATRALLRPYNFFADVRDQRIISGAHTLILLFILVSVNALLITNLLFFLRNNILVEKILLSFGIENLVNIFGFLSWNPMDAFFYLFLYSLAIFLIITLLLKAASFFIRTKINYTSIGVIAVWAFLPLVLFLPVELVLYRILIADVINLFIYIFLGLYLIWLIQRLLKGVHVIFDVRLSGVYFYSILFLIIVGGGTLLYFQFSENSIYYISNAYKQFKLM